MRQIAPLLLLLLAGCEQKPVIEDYDRDSQAQSFVDRKRVPELQKIATNACLCERNRGNNAEAECWSDFWEEVNDYRHGSVASACGPGSSAFVDFDEASAMGSPSAELSVTTDWGYGACSADEVETKKVEYERKNRASGC